MPADFLQADDVCSESADRRIHPFRQPFTVDTKAGMNVVCDDGKFDHDLNAAVSGRRDGGQRLLG
jgi:hypothetical protein